MHAPALQVPGAVPAVQVAPSLPGTLPQPEAAAQESTVQGFWSLQAIGPGEAQVPWPLQTSAPLQALPSPHAVPVATGAFTQVPVATLQLSVVQALPSLQEAGHIGGKITSGRLSTPASGRVSTATSGRLSTATSGRPPSGVTTLQRRELVAPTARRPSRSHNTTPADVILTETTFVLMPFWNVTGWPALIGRGRKKL